MRVTTALSPSLLHRIAFRTPLLAGLVCAALAVSGCAGRSVLGEKKLGLSLMYWSINVVAHFP